MELDQWWRLWHRTAHRWIEKGWSCCQDGLQRNLCEGSEMSRLTMVEMETATLERSGERQNGLAHTHSGSKSTGGRAWLLEEYPNSLEMQTVYRNLFKKTRVGCILLKTVEVGNSFRNVEGAQHRWSPVPRGPMRVRLDWDECWCYLVGKGKKREMVQSWLWLAGFVWRWVWTSTWLRWNS